MTDIEILLRKALPQSIQTPYSSSLPPGIKSSAVLVVLQNEENVWKLLFTRRGKQLADHRGQVAFPGGHVEAGDSGPLQTALREASEEVGIPSDAVDPLGILDPVDTSTGFRIWPVVCLLSRPVVLKPAFPEVHEFFWIPLAWLMEKGRWEWKPVSSDTGRSERRAIFFEAYQGRIIWGATAMITYRLIELINERQTS
jgi:8-oxo-dGTP pyrophosphatase MutT (NUDIX family)